MKQRTLSIEAYTAGPREALEKQSPEFARRTVSHLRFLWANVRADEQQFKEVLEEVKALRIYEWWPPEKPYGGLEELCEAELGASLPVVEQTVSELAVARAERDGKLTHRGKQAKDNSIIFADRQGTDPTYLARRLLRDAPKDFERLKAGEYPSVYAAAVAAGIQKRRISADPTPGGFVRAIQKHLSAQQIKEVVRRLSEER